MIESGIITGSTGAAEGIAAGATTGTVATGTVLAVDVAAKTTSSGIIGGCIGLALLAFGTSAAAEENKSPDPRMVQYQAYLIQWVIYAVNELKYNGGNFQSIKSIKSFRRWLQKPGI